MYSLFFTSYSAPRSRPSPRPSRSASRRTVRAAPSV
nr:MAG TPA: hypothetical protein [Caudoviricetes sp.]